MSHVKHKSRFSPNVGTALFALAGIVAPAQAAYTVIDQVTMYPDSPRPSLPTLPVLTRRVMLPNAGNNDTPIEKPLKPCTKRRKHHCAMSMPTTPYLQLRLATSLSVPTMPAPHNAPQEEAPLQLAAPITTTTSTDAPAQASRPVREVIYTTPAQMPTPAEAHIWNIQAGRTLKSTVEEWANLAGWKPPVWMARDPYYIETSFPFQGSLIDALTQINALVPNLDFQLSISKKTILVTDRKTVKSRSSSR